MKRLALFSLLLAISLCPSVQVLSAQTSSRPAITGVAFGRFYTTDPARAQQFYGDTLGLTRQQDGATWRYPVNRLQWIEILTAPAPPEPNSRLAAIGFNTADAAALQAYLQAKGIHPETPLHDGQFSVRDPEGYLVVFVQQGSEAFLKQAKPSPIATSRRIIHVGFIARDLDRENAFWRDILGFRPYWHGGPSDTVTSWVSEQVPDGSDWLELMLNQPAQPTLKQTGVMDHVSLGAAHIQDVTSALARNGCTSAMCTASKVGRDGKVQLNMYDPDQTRIEFMEFTPVEQPCCSPFTGKHPTATDPNE